MLSLKELMNLSCNLGTLKGRILFISFIVLLYNRDPMLEIIKVRQLLAMRLGGAKIPILLKMAFV